MLKISREEVNFLKEHLIGKQSYIIELSQKGYQESVENLIKNVSPHQIITIKGDESLTQQKELNDLCKKIQKINPLARVLVFINGKTKPLTTANNIEFIVKLQTHNLHCLEDTVLKRLNKLNVEYVFEMHDEDDLDLIENFAIVQTIKKDKINIIVNDNFKENVFKIKLKGFNVYITFEGDWYD